MSAAALVASLLAAGVEVEAEGDRVRLRSPRPGILRPEHAAAVRELKPSLLLVGSGRWREELAGWPPWWRGRWAELARGRQGEGLALERAEQLAFLEVAELPDEAAPLERSPVAELLAPGAPLPVIEECARCGACQMPRAVRCDLCGGRRWRPREEHDQEHARPASEGPADEGEEAPRRSSPGGWVVHPQACGGCGAKALASRGLGPCRRCGWQKPEGEPFALAYRLATDAALAHRLEGDG